MGVRYNARMARRKTKWNFSVEANMKVFELSNAVVEDGFAERAEVVLKKDKLRHRAIMLISPS